MEKSRGVCRIVKGGLGREGEGERSFFMWVKKWFF